MTYPLPASTRRAWEQWRSQRPQNPGLIFDRFAPDWHDQPTRKRNGLEAVREASRRSDPELLDAWRARWTAIARAIGAEPFALRTGWRLIAGLGRKGPLEVGFTFHRYGFPVLPGSSVKGLARAAALDAAAARLATAGLNDLDRLLSEPDEKAFRQMLGQGAPDRAAAFELASDFRAIFGTTAAAGQAVFLEGIPGAAPTLELDIMNPHFARYYGGEEPPIDGDRPIPFNFLAVAAQSEFLFAVGWRGVRDAEGERRRRLAQEWLFQGLTELGAGGKTNAGYGYFQQDAQNLAAAADRASAGSGAAVSVNPPPATGPVAAPAAPELPLEWRLGTVREYRPDRGRGRLRDDTDGQEWEFRREAIAEKGWSPGKGARVAYAIQQQAGMPVIVEVRRR